MYYIYIRKRVLNEAKLLSNSNMTIREVANILNIGKSTVHKDLTERLPLIDISLYEKVKSTLYNHLKTRHIKGGEVTKSKYKKIK